MKSTRLSFKHLSCQYIRTWAIENPIHLKREGILNENTITWEMFKRCLIHEFWSKRENRCFKSRMKSFIDQVKRSLDLIVRFSLRESNLLRKIFLFTWWNCWTIRSRISRGLLNKTTSWVSCNVLDLILQRQNWRINTRTNIDLIRKRPSKNWKSKTSRINQISNSKCIRKRMKNLRERIKVTSFKVSRRNQLSLTFIQRWI